MGINRSTWVLIAVAGLSYAAGRGGSPSPVRAAQPPDHHGDAYRAAGAPSAHHTHLEALVGEWSGEFAIRMTPDAAPVESRGTVRRRWVLDGRFLEEKVTAESEQGAFRGLGFIGYNNFDGRYETVWMDTMSTAIHSETGTFHEDTRILHTRGSQRDPVTGRVTTTWAKLDMSEADRHTATGWAVGPDGRVFTAFEGVLERVR